ncbi:MAG: aldehyde ferredoxin oxidoreductase family protein, partial [Thermoguttaceae bacterium]
MAIKSGYFKKHLKVDLSAGTIETSALADPFLEEYIGGRGFGAKLVWDNLVRHDFQIDPLGPDNLLVMAPGPLTGLYLPSSGKCSFMAVSPATGGYGDSSIGGGLGVELRQAGYDLLSVAGRAPELSILLVEEDGARIVPMPELAGKSCLAAEGLIKEQLGTHEVKVAVIGPAGENLVRFAAINADWSRNAGRTGMGAVMGSKNLKAIVLSGAKDLPVHDLPALIAESATAYGYMRGHNFFKMWQNEGLMMVMSYASALGILPTHNFKDATFPKVDKLNGETMLDGHKIGDSACFSCAMSCGNICLVKQGNYCGTVTEGPEYESCAMFGSNLGIDNFSFVLEANELCDELGLDTISTGNLIGAVIEGYETGILSLDDLDGRPITWGDEEAVAELIHRINERRGIGDTLAGGAKAVLARWPEMNNVLLHVKGLEQSAYDSRAASSMALAYATSDIGAHHARAWTIAKEIEEGEGWSDEKKVDLVIYHQSLRPLFDMLGVCRFPWIELGLNEEHYARFYSHATGKTVTLADLLEKSSRIYDLTRLINTRLGMSRRDDTMPHKVQHCPIRTGATAGRRIDGEQFERLLDLY